MKTFFEDMFGAMIICGIPVILLGIFASQEGAAIATLSDPHQWSAEPAIVEKVFVAKAMKGGTYKLTVLFHPASSKKTIEEEIDSGLTKEDALAVGARTKRSKTLKAFVNRKNKNWIVMNLSNTAGTHHLLQTISLLGMIFFVGVGVLAQIRTSLHRSKLRREHRRQSPQKRPMRMT